MGHQEASLLWVICVLVNHEELQMHVFIFSTVAKWLYFCRQHFPMGLSLVQDCSNSIALAMELLQSWDSILVFWLNIHLSLVPGVINNNAVLIQMLSADKQQAITWTNDDLVHWHIYVSPDRSELKQLWCIASEVVFNALNLLVLKTEYSRTWSVPWLLTHSLQWCMMASQITSLTIVYSTVYSRRRSNKPQSFASLAFVRGIHWWLVNSPHKGPVTRKMFPFDDAIMGFLHRQEISNHGIDSTACCILVQKFKKKTYELLNVRALIISVLYEKHIFKCMDEIFCVVFQR